jgi:RNA polymerase sigma-B factor
VGNSVRSSEKRPAPDATADLLRAYHLNGDAGARSRLAELYLPLVASLARRHARGAQQYEDLVQVGSIGLLNAIDRFDLARGGEFAAFAVPNIAGEIKRHLRDSGEAVRLPRGLAELRGRIPAAREALTARLAREPTAAELASELGATEQLVAAALSAGSQADGAADELPSADSLVGADERLALADALEELDESERQIVYLRFVRDLDPEQVAGELGISRRHLSRRTQAALAKLRGHLEQERPEAPLPRETRRPNIPAVKPGPAHEAARYLSRPYHIVLVQDGERGWIAQVEELPGCEARGRTPDEATHAIRGSMEAWISDALAKHREIPEPRGAASHSGRLMLRMPQSLHAELARAAERDDVSLNQFITSSLASAVGWRRPAGTGSPAGPEAQPDDTPARSPRNRLSARWAGRAMVANAVLLGLAGIAALTLLVVALVHG